MCKHTFFKVKEAGQNKLLIQPYYTYPKNCKKLFIFQLALTAAPEGSKCIGGKRKGPGTAGLNLKQPVQKSTKRSDGMQTRAGMLPMPARSREPV